MVGIIKSTESIQEEQDSDMESDTIQTETDIS